MYESEAKAARDLTANLIERHGVRLTGSPACLAAAEELARLAAAQGDSSFREEFRVRPGAFLGFIRVMLVLYILALNLLPFLPWAAAGLLGLGALVLVLEFFLYREFTDLFYPARRALNVGAVLEPRGKVKRQVILSGHHDSARVFNFYVEQPERYGAKLYGGMGAYAAFLAGSILLALLDPPRGVLISASTLFLFLFLFAAPLWKFAAKEGTPGAGDNLAASALALELLKHFRARRDAGAGLESTRLVFASFDAEEAGLRGARAWAKRRAREFAALPSWNYNMDCLYSAEDARFLTSDLNCSVPLSAQAAEACAEAARKLGAAAPTEPIAFLTGGTDAAELAKRGVRATTLIGMEWSNGARSGSYHTPGDTIEAVSPAVLELAFGVGLDFVERLDRGELD